MFVDCQFYFGVFLVLFFDMLEYFEDLVLKGFIDVYIIICQLKEVIIICLGVVYFYFFQFGGIKFQGIIYQLE